jgi:hypothetical protein
MTGRGRGRFCFESEGCLFLLTAEVFIWRGFGAQALGDVSLATPWFARLLLGRLKEKGGWCCGCLNRHGDG